MTEGERVRSWLLLTFAGFVLSSSAWAGICTKVLLHYILEPLGYRSIAFTSQVGPEIAPYLISVGERFPEFQPIKVERRRHKFYSEVYRFFLNSPIPDTYPEDPMDVEVYTFQIPLASGKRHSLSVLMSLDHAPTLRDTTNREYATFLVSQLPWATIAATSYIELSHAPPLDFSRGMPITFSRGQADRKGRMWLRVEAAPTNWKGGVLSLLFHEHGHHVGYKYFGRGLRRDLPYPAHWEKIMAQDERAPEVHTAGPLEDFAESFALYYLHRGEKDQYRKDYEHRSKSLDHFFCSLGL